MASLAKLALFVGSAAASQWTVTSHYVVKPTTSVWTYYDETYTDTTTLGLKSGATPTAEAFSTYTSTYDDIEYVEVYYDGEDVDEDDIMTTTSYDYGYNSPYTYFVQAIEYTAPTSCPTPFTVQTWTEIDVPDVVADQISYKTISTSVYTYDDGDTYTQITAYVDDTVTTVTAATSDWIYSYYIADCRNPTATGAAFYGGGDDDDYNGSRYGGGGSYWDTCWNDYHCNSLAIYVIVLASVIPALFIFGFLENYFWFRRMMIGKFSLRFGTCLWIFLLLPILCFTRQCPARDPETQKALQEQWKNVGFSKALGLWFRWGFRHKYPVELLGTHPLYHNPAPGQAQMGQMPPGPPPPGGYVYYAPGPPGAAPDGQPFPPPGPPPEGWKGQPSAPQQFGAPPPGMVLYYPQYPPQAHAPPQQAPSSAPSPVSAMASAPSDIPQPTASPQPSAAQSYSAPVHAQELGSHQPTATQGGNDTNNNNAGSSSAGPSGGN